MGKQRQGKTKDGRHRLYVYITTKQKASLKEMTDFTKISASKLVTNLIKKEIRKYDMESQGDYSEDPDFIGNDKWLMRTSTGVPLSEEEETEMLSNFTELEKEGYYVNKEIKKFAIEKQKQIDEDIKKGFKAIMERNKLEERGK